MAAFCLPRKYTRAFTDGLRDGSINPQDLVNKSSAERREFFTGLFGEDSAKEVNALFESKLLLKDQQRGMIAWAEQLSGLKPGIKKDIVDKIQGMDRVLQPVDERSFLQDLANKKLGLSVSSAEAQKLFDMSSRVKQAEGVMRQDISNLQNRRTWGLAKMDLIDTMNEMKPNGQSFKENLIQALGIPKQLLTGEFHFTAPIQQNWGLMTTKQWAEGWPKMFGFFKDEQNYRNLMADIISHPMYELAKDGDLGLTSLGDTFTTREEENMSRILEKLNQHLTDKTGIGNLFRASSRGFTGFSNYVRFYRFVDLVNAAKISGEDISKGSQVLKDLAGAVNDFSGRGKLPFEIEGRSGSLTTALNILFFAPRKLMGTVNMFKPSALLGFDVGELRQISPTARNARIRQLSGSLAATGAILSLASVFGYSVNVNPISQDFLLVDTPGGQKFDITGGNALFARLVARIIMNKEINAKGKELDFGEGYKPETRASAVADFLRGKLSPMAGIVGDAAVGSDPVGRPFAVDQEVKDKLVPIVAGQFIDYYMNNPNDAADILPSIFSLAGISMRSPQPVASRHGVTQWGEQLDWPYAFNTKPQNDIDKEINRLGGTSVIAPKTINGISLTPEEDKRYIAISGQTAKSLLEPLLQSPNWGRVPDAQKMSTIKSLITAARSKAQGVLQSDSIGDPNGLMARIIKKDIGQ